jgi:hypothetical protein
MLRQAQEVLGTVVEYGQNIFKTFRYAPTAGGVEQYINGELRAQIAGENWPQWVAVDDTARRAQLQDDAMAAAAVGTEPAPAPTPAPVA